MRRALALCLLVVLTVSAGCTSLFGPGEVPDEQLNENATYDDVWEQESQVYIDVRTDTYRAVYDLGENRTTLDVYGRTGFGLERPLDISGLQFQYANGTVVTPANDSNFTVDQGREELTITVPEANGTLAFTAPKAGKSFTVPAFIEGVSYEAALPPNTGVAIPLLSNVNPGPTRTEVIDGRTHVFWQSVSRDISVRYYLDRDLLIFGSLAVLMVIAGVAGGLYYLRQIRDLERRREEVALDVNRKE